MPSTDSLNSDLAIAGLALSWDPDRPTCVQVAAIYDSALGGVSGDATPAISPCDSSWTSPTVDEIRICGHTTEPTVGTQLVEVDDTVCATDNFKTRALACLAVAK